MADRPVAEAVADLRLSNAKFGQDVARARSILLNAVRQLEKDAQVAVGLSVDFRQVRTQLAREFGRIQDDGGITIPVKLDTDDALEDLVTLEGIAKDQTVEVPVGVNTDDALSELAALEQLSNQIDAIIAPVGLNTDPAYSAIPPFIDTASDQLAAGFGQGGQQAGQEFGRGFQSAAETFLTTVSLTLGGFFSLSLVRGFQRLTTIEDALASLTVALNSAGDAAKVLEDVVDVVTGTPFNLDQFASAASNMISFGIEAEKVPGYLTAIGEAAASQGSRANEFAQRLATTFGRISAANRLTNAEIESFTSVGVNALVILGNAFEVTAFEAREMIANGLIPAQEALEILSEGILSGTDGIAGQTNAFAGTMENLRETLTGAIGGFKAATARFGANIIDPIQETLTVGFNAASQVVDSFSRSFRDALDSIAESEGVARFQELLRDLPNQVGGLIETLQQFGPALAPITAAFGAAGLGQLKNLLGPLGAIIPPLGIATSAIAALIATTPELRSELLPILLEVGEVLIQVGGVVAIAGGEILESLIPALVQITRAAGNLVPFVKAAGDLVSILAVGLVPILSEFADAVENIPIPVLTALVAAFVGFKVVQSVSAPLERFTKSLSEFPAATEQAQSEASRTVRAFDAMGISAQNVQTAVQIAGVGIATALSGVALASDDATTQLTGLIGAATGIAAGFALGGPIGGGIAVLATGVGFLAGEFANAKREAKEFQDAAKGLADQLLDEFERLEGSNPFTKLAAELDILRTQVFRDTALDLISDEDLDRFEQFGVEFGDIIRLADAAAEGLASPITRVAELRRAIVDIEAELAVYANPITESDQFNKDQLEVELRETLALLSQFEAEASRIAGVDISLIDDKDVRDLEVAVRRVADLNAETERQAEAEARRRDQARRAEADSLLTSLGLTLVAFEELARVTGRAGQATDDLLISMVGGIDDTTTNVKELQNEVDLLAMLLGVIPPNLEDIVAGLDDAEDATVDVVRETEDWEDALKRVKAEFDDVLISLSDLSAELDIANIGERIAERARREVRIPIDGAGEGEEAASRAAEQLARRQEQIANQLQRIDELTQTVDEKRREAVDNALGLEAAIAEAESLGALEVAAGFRRALEEVNVPVEDAEERLQAAIDRLAELQIPPEAKERVGREAREIVIQFIDQLEQAANERQVSLLDFLITPGMGTLAQQGFKDLIEQEMTAAIRTTSGLIEKNPALAAELLEEARSALLVSFTDLFGPEDAERLVEQFFDVDPAIVEARALAFRNSLGGRLALADPIVVRVDGDFDEFDQTNRNARAEAEARITVPVEADLTDLERQLAEFAEEPILIQAIAQVQLTGGGGGGGMMQFQKEGGILGMGSDPAHIAQIAPAGAWRVWAEPETGGEAYIPLHPSKRARSTEILERVAEMFGMEIGRPGRGRLDAGTIADAIREGLSTSNPATRRMIAEANARSVTVAPNAITVVESGSGRKTARELVRELRRF